MKQSEPDSVATIPAADAGIRLANITVSRGGRPVLKDISLDISEKRIALVGLNGSGKSTLARTLNGLIAPDQGRVRVHGVDVGKDPRAAARTVGFVFQNPDHQIIFPTVAEDLGFGLRQIGYSKSSARQCALDLLAQHNCADWADRPISDLSEGQKHLVCILSVIVMKPKVLVLDEPFSSLDLAVRQHLRNLLISLDQQIVMISHDLDVFDGFDRMIWLKDGRAQADGRPEDVAPLFRRYAVETVQSLTPRHL